jgi:hypothetical protein
MSATIFGQQLSRARTAADRLALDREADRRGDLRAVDAIIDDLLVRGLAGERIVQLGDRYDDETVTLPALSDDALATIAGHVGVDAMERRGAWALPDRETVAAGSANYGWWVRQEPRFVGSLADDDRRKITLRANPTGTWAWAAITPIFELLCVPHDLRAAKAGKADAKAQAKAWAQLDAMLEATPIHLADELAPFRPASGWSRLSSQQRADARLSLVDGWARHATRDVAARLRMWMLGGLVDRFYAKAKTGTPTSRQALTKAHWRPLVALFGGDWLALLAYLGEQPNPGEEIASALPEPKLFVGGAQRAREAAADAGVDAAEVERMLASFFGSHDATGPVDRRLAALRRVWEAIDALHAAHTPQAGSLWGIFDERDEVHDTRFDDQYRKGLHRQLLSAEVNAEVTELWGTVATSKAPDRLVTRWLPHHGVWDALGPALHFWHEVALTTFAHTEVQGFPLWGLTELEERHRERLDELAAAGCPVDRALFADLIAAGEALGPVEYEKHVTRSEHEGLAIEMTFGGGDRLKRAGFERLRDVVTRHRRAWAAQSLDRWLEQRWQSDLRAAAEAFNRVVLAKGKPPTTRQRINASQPALDRWFGGDIGQLLTAIGQKGPAAPPTYERRLPADPYTFGKAVEHALGGGQAEPDMSAGAWDSSDRARLAEFRAVRDHNSARYYAAFAAYEYVRAWEALGQRPEMTQVKKGKSSAQFLDRDDPNAAWHQIEQAILAVLAADPAAPTVTTPALPFARPATAPPPVAPPRPAGRPAERDADPAVQPPEPRRRGALRRLFGRD